MENNILPIKTKIAAWSLIVFGIIFLGYQVSTLYPSYKLWINYSEFSFSFFWSFFAVLFNALIFILPGIFLIKRKKIAWSFAIAILTFFLIGAFGYLVMTIHKEDFNFFSTLAIIFYLLPIFPFIFLLLDRKKFFKIAS